MTDLRTAAQQALEALVIGSDAAHEVAQNYHEAMAGYRPARHIAVDDDVRKIEAAIAALRAALAEPEPQEIADLRQACQEGWRYADELDQERKRLEEVLRAALAEPVQEEEGLIEFLADLQRSRMKYPNNRRMFDGLMSEVDELRRAYAGDGDIRAEAFDVAVCAFRIATEGDSGGNTMLKQAEPVQEPGFWGRVAARQASRIKQLETAAQQALEAMRRAVPTGEITLVDWMKANHDLEAALAEPVRGTAADRVAFEAWLNPGGFAGNVSPWVEPGRYEKNTHQLAWLAWRACERRREAVLAEPVQEQPVCDECGKHKRDGWALYCVDCVEPLFAPPQPPDSKHAEEKA